MQIDSTKMIFVENPSGRYCLVVVNRHHKCWMDKGTLYFCGQSGDYCWQQHSYIGPENWQICFRQREMQDEGLGEFNITEAIEAGINLQDHEDIVVLKVEDREVKFEWIPFLQQEPEKKSADSFRFADYLFDIELPKDAGSTRLVIPVAYLFGDIQDWTVCGTGQTVTSCFGKVIYHNWCLYPEPKA